MRAETRRAFVDAAARSAPSDGRFQTSWPGLGTYRTSRPTAPQPNVYVPCLVVVAQGAKEAYLGDLTFRYDPLHYLILGAPLPVTSHIVEASPVKPFLSMLLEFDSTQVHDVLMEIEDGADGTHSSAADGGVGSEEEPEVAIWRGGPPIRTSPMDEPFLAALVRLLQALGDPMDRRVLAPQILREIVYLTLRRDQGDFLRLAAGRDGRSQGATRAMRYLRDHFDQPIDVPTVAREVGLSVSSLHHSFKEATTLTPIQYLKRIRLERARALMVDEGCQAAEAAHRVGYESPSQFSREFKRLYGQPPRRYVETWAETLALR